MSVKAPPPRELLELADRIEQETDATKAEALLLAAAAMPAMELERRRAAARAQLRARSSSSTSPAPQTPQMPQTTDAPAVEPELEHRDLSSTEAPPATRWSRLEVDDE